MAESSSSTQIDLEKELTCSICTDVLYQPLTLLDCLHTFCGSCLKVWFQWQASKSSDAGKNPYTCPSCRASVRATSSDAKINSLLDIYLLANPGKAKTEEEKKDIAGKYTKGDDVLPRPSRVDDQIDEVDRRMVEEARELSLRDLDHRSNHHGYERGVRHRHRSRERRREAEGSRSSTDSRSQARHIEHQSSLRSLISTDELDSTQMVDEILRQISEDGLFNGIDIHNLSASQEDELSERIAEAYRRRHGQGTRSPRNRDPTSGRGGSSPSAPSPSSRRSSSRGSPSGALPAPSTRRHARSTSAVEDPSRHVNPPVTRPHLLDAEAAVPGHRRRRSSESRRQTSPVPRTAPVQQQAARSATDLSSHQRNSAGRQSARERRPVDLDVQGRRHTDPRARRLSDGGEGSQSQSRSRTSPRTSSRPATSTSTAEPSSQRSGTQRPQTGSEQRTAITTSPQSTPRPVAPDDMDHPSPRLNPSSSRNTQPQIALFPEPSITCDRCGREHIEYELHENCSTCKNGQYNLCHRCYRQGEGCLHWYGFGTLAWYRFQQGTSHQDPPHSLIGRQYIRPKPNIIHSQATGTNPAMTTEAPSNRLLIGAFCSICHSHADDCFWKCDYCNYGEWGYCNTCVNTGRICTHPLLPIAHISTNKPTSAFPSQHSEAHFAPITSPSMMQHYPPSNISSPGQYRPLSFSTACNICYYPIVPSSSRYHCYTCNGGDYDICSLCYAKLVDSGRIAREDGDKGWRRCLRGHRMIKVWFEDTPAGQCRVVVNDLVGGHFLEEGDRIGRVAEQASRGGSAADGRSSGGGGGEWSWVESGGQRRTRTLSHRLFDESGRDGGPSETVLLQHFPPDGGVGLHVVAIHPRLPKEGAADELGFPKGAEIREVLKISDDWSIGYYAGAKGLFPMNHVTIVGGASM